jgi:hypothetical protein
MYRATAIGTVIIQSDGPYPLGRFIAAAVRDLVGVILQDQSISAFNP